MDCPLPIFCDYDESESAAPVPVTLYQSEDHNSTHPTLGRKKKRKNIGDIKR